tara:strand:+ start:845 stop:1840 length:996 start_codon:yes stop_codon:yes gene_type:complete
MTMRNIFVTEKGSENSLNKWEFETPKDIRSSAIAEMTTRLSQNVSALKKGRIARFKMQFKSKRKSKTETIGVPKTSIKFKDGKVSIFSRYLSPIKLGKRFGKKCKYGSEVTMDSRIHYDGKDFYLFIPKKIDVKTCKGSGVIALDPGTRVFQTGYSEKEYFESHINNEKYEQLKTKIRLIQSLYSNAKNSKSKCRTRRKIFILHKKIKNLVSECHWKTANYLVSNYGDVLLPTFESQDMVRNCHLRRKTKNDLLALSHYKFKIRLHEKAHEFKQFAVHDVNESYTSKTCSCCGNIQNIGSKKVYKCESCSMIMDRDVNAARNILIKHINVL